VSGELISNQNGAPFDNTAYVDLGRQWDHLQDTGTATTQVVLRDMSMSLSPYTQYSILGEQVTWDVDLANNGDTVCTGLISYSLQNGIDWVSSSLPGFEENTPTQIILNPGATWSESVLGEISILEWNPGQLYMQLEGTYDCGDGVQTFDTEFGYVEPIADLVVDKTVTSVNPSNTGDLVEYEVTLYNRGSETAVDYRLYDLFPTNFLYDISINVEGEGVVIPIFDGTQYYIED